MIVGWVPVRGKDLRAGMLIKPVGERDHAAFKLPPFAGICGLARNPHGLHFGNQCYDTIGMWLRAVSR